MMSEHLLYTCTSVSLFHPNVTVGLGYTSLRVQKRHEDAALSTQTCVVTVTLLHRISVILLTQPESEKTISYPT